MESVINSNKKGVSENIAISWISCILIAKKRPYYAIKWTWLSPIFIFIWLKWHYIV